MESQPIAPVKIQVVFQGGGAKLAGLMAVVEVLGIREGRFYRYWQNSWIFGRRHCGRDAQ
jgi:hypothetical protein